MQDLSLFVCRGFPFEFQSFSGKVVTVTDLSHIYLNEVPLKCLQLLIKFTNTASQPHKLFDSSYTIFLMSLTGLGIIQDGADETHVFSYKNNFVYFQHKKVLITQKRRYFNAFLKYVPNYVRKIMSDDVLLAGHTFQTSPQSHASHAPTFFAVQLRFLDECKVSAFQSCMVCSCTLYTGGIPTKKKVANR